ncbi:preprotein translocase subunit SecE [Myxococcota bacterium]|nr:preprotein translocase subunit SecE [Myxococcota bacterium]
MTETTEESRGLVERSLDYVREVRGEFDKITWPPQTEMVNGTIAVLVIVVVMATFLGIVDFGLSRVMQMVLG